MKENVLKKVYRLLFILHAFVGIGAMGGGMMAILNPLEIKISGVHKQYI